MKDINKAIKVNSVGPDAYFTSAGLYMIKNKYKEAISDYKKVQKLSPDNSSSAEFFEELAENAMTHPNMVFFNKFNVSFKIDEDKIIFEYKEKN